jgi:hypothetical protein
MFGLGLVAVAELPKPHDCVLGRTQVFQLACGLNNEILSSFWLATP